MRLKEMFSGIYIFLAHMVSQDASASQLSKTLDDTYSKTATYTRPNPNDLSKAKALFYDIFKSPQAKPNEESWNSLGFEVEKIGKFLVIKEKKDAQSGKGVYAFNTTQPTDSIVQAPHHISDKYTGTIARQLLAEGKVFAMARNTINRRKVNYTDTDESFFNAFTEAYAMAFPKGKIIQLHGFDTDSHDTESDIILSNTTKVPPPSFSQFEKCLQKLSVKVSLYPDAVHLGGTKNTGANKFLKLARDGFFIHIEMSETLREKLKTKKDYRSTFIQCLHGTGKES